jgi:dihydrofolate reductase
MRKSIIVATDENNGIGYLNKLPWHLPVDLKYFKELTMSHHILMGRRTYESIGRPLPGRPNIIISRNPDFQAEGCQVVNSIAKAITIAESNLETEVFICGGSSIYRDTLHIADRLYITRIHETFQCDKFFPEFDKANWKEVSKKFCPPDNNNIHPLTFFIYERRN